MGGSILIDYVDDAILQQDIGNRDLCRVGIYSAVHHGDGNVLSVDGSKCRILQFCAIVDGAVDDMVAEDISQLVRSKVSNYASNSVKGVIVRGEDGNVGSVND